MVDLTFHDRFAVPGLPSQSSVRRFSSVGVGFHLRGVPPMDDRDGLTPGWAALTKSSTLPRFPSPWERDALKALISS